MNYVIYMISTSSDLFELPLLCAAFLKLFDHYAAALKGHQPEDPNDVVLHILPLAAIASNEHLVIPAPSAYKQVAFEIYSRCAPRKDLAKLSPFYCAPAIHLARPIPRAINFTLASTPITGLSQADRCIHVGYCWDPDATWLSTSWTDNTGSLQWNACYRLTVSGSQTWPSFEEVANEIWDTTLTMLNPKNMPWRCIIAKGGSMSQMEASGRIPMPPHSHLC